MCEIQHFCNTIYHCIAQGDDGVDTAQADAADEIGQKFHGNTSFSSGFFRGRNRSGKRIAAAVSAPEAGGGIHAADRREPGGSRRWGVFRVGRRFPRRGHAVWKIRGGVSNGELRWGTLFGIDASRERSVLGGHIDAVLDDNGHRSLGDFAARAPGHTLAGETVHADGGHDANEGLADVGGAHVGGAAGGLQGLVNDVDTVIRVCGELVGGLAVLGLIRGNEGLGALVLGVRGEGGQEHDALGQGGVEALHGEDAVHAVHAEEGGLITGGLGLGEDDGSLLIVDGQEHDGGAGALGGVDLDGEVRGGVGGEGALGDDVHTLGGSFGLEGVADALGVGVVVLIDDGHVLTGKVLGNVVGGAGALVGR